MKELNLNINIDFNNFRESLKSTLIHFSKTPALRHGIEQAILNLICKEKQTTLDKLLGIKLKNEIKVNAAIGLNSVEDTIKIADEFIRQGYKTLKVKCGRDDFNQEIECLRLLRENFGNEIKVRIDVNGGWNLNQAFHNLREIESVQLEYAEQPVSSFNDMAALKSKSRIKIAADESVRSTADAEKIINANAADVLILKPMMIGGLLPTIEIIELAQKNKIDCVITSSFESAIGRTSAVIAAAYTKCKMAHGLAINNFFEKDITEDLFPVISGKIKLT